MNETIETGRIVGLASEGQGIVRHEGLVTFIPYTAVGDSVSYETIKRKKNFAIGNLLQVIEPSPERTTPLCQYYGTCGGCQLQHIKYEAQVEYKRKWIEDALKKIGKFENTVVPPVTPANLQWAYRRRVNLVLRRHGDAFQAGYIATDNKSLVAVETCPIFIEKNDPIIKLCRKYVRNLRAANHTTAK